MMASSGDWSLSAMSVSRRYDPMFRLSDEEDLEPLMPCSRQLVELRLT